MPDDPSPPRASAAGWLKWPSIAAVLIVAIICISLMRSCEKLSSIAAVVNGAGTQQTITDSFRESIRKVTGTQGDILEVATLEADETFTRMDAKSLAWNLIYLGTTISEIRAAAVYRYHMKISDPWTLTTQGNTCTIIAPAIRPTLPPALRTEKMEKKTQAGWGRFNAAQNLDELEKSITPTLERRAGNPTHLASIREPARHAVAQFVKAWLLRDQQQLGISKIIVVFSDEPASKDAAALSKVPTTLDLQ